MKSITLEEFLEGKPLSYRGYDFRKTLATFQVGDGVYLDRRGESLGRAGVTTVAEATRLYHNLTRDR